MQIVQVDLENVKSYARASIAFAPGTNAICGQNGAGKSTLLEAVGFALFNYLQVTRSEFVREGEKTAVVTVHVIGADERLYHVVRKCGSSNQVYIYDPELEQKLAEGNTDTHDWLHEFLGVDETSDLATLFRDAVGVPQGLLTAAFLETPARRKDVFNPLLRVDEYERAWDTLRGAKSWIEKRLQEYEKQIAGLEAEVHALPEREVAFRSLEEILAAGEARLAALENDLIAVTERKKTLEALKAQLEELERAVLRTAGEQQTLAARLKESQAALERATAAQAVVAETEAGHQAYLIAQSELATLESKRDERDSLHAAQQQVEKQLAQIETKLESLAQELGRIIEAESEMHALRPQVEEQERAEAALADARLAADRLAVLQQAHSEAQAQQLSLQQQLTQTQAGVAERVQAEVALNAVQAALIPLDAEHVQLAQIIATQQAEQKSLGDRQRQVQKQIQQAEHDLAHQQQRLTELEALLLQIQQGLAERQQVEVELEAVRNTLDNLESQRVAQIETAEAYKAALKQLETQIAALTTTEGAQCPVCEGLLTPEHRTALLERQQMHQAELEDALRKVLAEQQAGDKMRCKQEKALRTLQERLQTLPRPDEVEALDMQIAIQKGTCAERETVVAEMQAEHLELQARLANLETELGAAQIRHQELAATRAAQQRRRDTLAQRLQTLPRPVEVEALQEQMARLSATIAEKQATAAELSGAPEEVARQEQVLVMLGNPRQAYQGASAIARRRGVVDEQQSQAEQQRAEHATSLKEMETALIAFAELDGQLATTRAMLTEHTPAYQRYQEHIREAEAAAERQALVNMLTEQVAMAEAAHAEQVALRDAVAGEYDAETYAQIAAQYAALGQELAGLKAQLQEQRKQQTGLQDEIARLHEVQARLSAIRAEHTEHLELLTLLEYLRRTLRDAGPEITKALVEVISLHADQLYADIMQDYSARLRWTDDYDIVLNTDGRVRSFQQLSGGEQMAAALAVRLALLREISAIDVAFFDEPTANLDRDRRANLAAQILNVKGFTQLFVISHDDTFEEDTDHVVHIVKRNGLSAVDMGAQA